MLGGKTASVLDNKITKMFDNQITKSIVLFQGITVFIL